MAGALSLSRELLLCYDSGFEPDRAEEWKLCLRVQNSGWTLFYREAWYLAENMRHLAETVTAVARQLPEGRRLRDLTLVSDADLAAMEAFPHWEQASSAKCIPEMLARAAVRFPEHIAVVYEGDTLTYAHLDQKTDAIAAKLAAMGIGRGSVVSTLLPRCKWMPVVAIAILKTGAAYQPLDPSYPPERLNFMAQDARAALVIADRALTRLLPDYQGPFLFLDELDALPAAGPLNREIGPADPFILLYTSGTTGTPKGVVLCHGNLVNFVDWYWQHMVAKYPELERGQSASQTGRNHIPPRIFKEITRLTKQRERLEELLGSINPFNGKSKAQEISRLLDKYIPNVERMHTQLKKYNAAFTDTATENAALKKENASLEAELESKSQESIEKRLREAQLHRDYQQAMALLDRIPKDILDQAKWESRQAGKQRESR